IIFFWKYVLFLTLRGQLHHTIVQQRQFFNPKSKIENPKWIDGGPHLRLRFEVRGCLLVEEAARVAQKSSCTAQSCS
ncbi:hypothetical protein QUA30_17940, partial [Microcoleus sp. Pol14C2]|uniref:hypothetical protein n=1 Tax=unclassified Microcoleus TaxID=2642155 RepID=UPI002FD09ECC